MTFIKILLILIKKRRGTDQTLGSVKYQMLIKSQKGKETVIK